MVSAVSLALALLGAAPPAPPPPPAPAQPREPGFVVVTEKYALDAGFGAIAGEHTLRFPAPPPARIAALRPGAQLTVPSASVTGETRMSVEEPEHQWQRTYRTDPRRERGATLTIARTSAGIELSTALYLEDAPFTSTDPRDANDPQSLRGACRFVLAQGVSFLVTTLDATGRGALVGSYHGQGEWNEARKCRGKVAATLEAR